MATQPKPKKSGLRRVHNAICPFWWLRKVPVLNIPSKVLPCCRISAKKEAAPPAK